MSSLFVLRDVPADIFIFIFITLPSFTHLQHSERHSQTISDAHDKKIYVCLFLISKLKVISYKVIYKAGDLKHKMAPNSSSGVYGSPEIPNLYEKTLFTPFFKLKSELTAKFQTGYMLSILA